MGGGGNACGHCGQCGGLMVLDTYDPDERVCSSCGRSTFKPDPAPYKARNWERRAPRGPSMPEGHISVRRFK